ncbi:MAG: Unknown protein [uncultured Sulfurovum sp.]|uniref:PD-(D/E)XK nuclease superfamily protein n=1 Tax=uncultured Sulfurovum sp. TaxID=269237 RepID=A0A6S6S0U1_9BACT|nr:MAG: Unknown protein [uncultured Sulfurovum sp.]
MDKEYIELFKLIEEVSSKQEAQKMRGLNDYNMVNVVRKASHEVGMHSNVIYSLINPNGLHYQNDLFLNLFIEEVLNIRLNDFGRILEVNVEEQTNKNRRIDFTIKSENYFIGIEMKVNAGDLRNQISHYDEYLLEEADTQKVLMYYLTKDGKDAPLRSKGSVFIEKISFQEHILNWLDICQNEVKNITNLNVALEDYKNIVKKITDKYRGNVVSIEEELIKSKKYLKTVLLIDSKIETIKGRTLYSFFEELSEVLKNESLKYSIDKIKDITTDLNDEGRKVSLNKCINLYKKARNKPKFFGKIFDCSFNNNLYFSVELHVGYLYYGLIKLDDFNLIALTDDDRKLFKGISSVKDTRYVKKVTNTLLNDNILFFEKSDLQDEIMKFIHQIKESQNRMLHSPKEKLTI